MNRSAWSLRRQGVTPALLQGLPQERCGAPGSFQRPPFPFPVFAYGATGAGKTYTMLGSEQSPGIMYLTMVELYKRIEARKDEKSCEVLVSYQEVTPCPHRVPSCLRGSPATRQGWRRPPGAPGAQRAAGTRLT